MSGPLQPGMLTETRDGATVVFTLHPVLVFAHACHSPCWFRVLFTRENQTPYVVSQSSILRAFFWVATLIALTCPEMETK
ncbi:MAG: hypothetical protein EOO66_31280 [Methylobacterium sp.]|nr:MAG: hypothetical protein EOO66_31280 [Methylobacterium sp.]